MWRRSPRSLRRQAPARFTGSSCTTKSQCSTRSPAISACCRRLQPGRTTTNWPKRRARIRVSNWNAAWLASLPASKRKEFLESLPTELAQLYNDQWFLNWAHDSQIPPPGDWRVWLLLAGRGFGKTRTGAEFVRAHVEAGLAQHVALVAPTALDARSVMV